MLLITIDAVANPCEDITGRYKKVLDNETKSTIEETKQLYSKLEQINASLTTAKALSDDISAVVPRILKLRDEVETFHAKLEKYFKFRNKVTGVIRKNYDVFKEIVRDLYQVGVLTKRRFDGPLTGVNITLLFESFKLIANKVVEYQEKVSSVMSTLDSLLSEIDLNSKDTDPLERKFNECIRPEEVQETQNMIVEFKLSIQFVIKVSYKKVLSEEKQLMHDYEQTEVKLNSSQRKFKALTKQKEIAASID